MVDDALLVDTGATARTLSRSDHLAPRIQFAGAPRGEPEIVSNDWDADNFAALYVDRGGRGSPAWLMRPDGGEGREEVRRGWLTEGRQRQWVQ